MTTVLYVGTEEGLVTVKGGNGSAWELENRALEDWLVAEVACDPAAPNVVFAGTRGDGVWRSDDAGKSWKKPSYGKRGPGKVQCLTLDAKERRLYAGGEPIDLFASDDAGASWERLESVREHPYVGTITYPVATVEPHVRDIALDPADSKVMYIALQVGHILKTADGGASWKLLEKGHDADVHTIAIDSQDSGKVLIATGGHECRGGTASGKALYRSDDGGETWSPTAMDFYQEYSIPLVRQPGNPKIAFAGLARGHIYMWGRPSGAEGVLIRTQDGGQTWQQVAAEVPDISQRMAVAIAFDQAEPSNVFAALDDGGIIASKDSGDSWTKLGVRTPAPMDLKCVRL